ncbi:MAG: tail fiber domain-containing protein [Bacteroidota bacterium]|nr:tail fiber domain-containing protein [Bacteroidota bacterium]
MKSLLILFVCFISINVFSQNITNTLGTSGVFTIKDASNNYLTINQSTGQVNILRSLRLENTTSSSLGVLVKGPDRFLHNYGMNNTFLGINSGNFTMIGNNNTALGFRSFFANSTGFNNTALGRESLYSNIIGSDNTAVGSQSLYFNINGINNTAVGGGSLFSNTTGIQNTAVGWKSLFSNTMGDDNTAVGSQSLYFNINGINNSAVGGGSLFSNTTGSNNTAVGWQSLFNSPTGYNNTAVGHKSLSSNTTGDNNTAVGRYSLISNTVGNGNTALGDNAGNSITTGNNLICIGKDAEPTTGTATDQMTLGNNQITSLRCNVTTITSLSDARDKKNITDLSLGIDFLMNVKPRLFNWDKREWYDNNVSDGSKMNEAPTAGFIAQKLDEVQTTEDVEWLNLVLKDNPEKLEATSGNLLPVMVKAIQELKVENDKIKAASIIASQESIELKKENKMLALEIESLKSMSEKIVKLEKLVKELTSLKHTSLIENKVYKTNLK